MGEFVRLLIDEPADGAWNIAVDEAILRAASVRWGITTVRLYMWCRPTISAGYFTRLDEELLNRCKRDGIDVVRRLSGGGIVLHDDEVTYSVVFPKSLIGECSVLAAYRLISKGVVIGLRRLGIEARLVCDGLVSADGQDDEVRACKESHKRLSDQFCYAVRSPTDIVVGSMKLVGSAQARCKGAILQHGSVPLRWDEEMLCRLFGNGIIEGRAFTSLEELLLNKPSVDEVVEALCIGFEKAFAQRLQVGMLSEEEINLAIKLMERKWIFRCE
ncbi:MAG: biotin/lipoate A/B protein ligase family protein [Armatimonadota bacterium]|nr:lipoate--protein ligase family protein [Armatimonadota bacterium]MCX7778032.1 lipoate--protein ligase family protein [Armatimonadota bacterium]MDW8024970.1 biotin/lipoate A/B protein ligase family protein [Armatimonadota bacterium]